MGRNKNLDAGAKAIAEDLLLPGGRMKKLSRVVEEHLDWFAAAEERGMTWDDMIATLVAAGVRRKSGLPLSRGSLSSAVWRKRRKAREGAAGRATRRDAAERRGVAHEERTIAPPARLSQKAAEGEPSLGGASSHGKTGSKAGRRLRTPEEEASNSAIRAYMRRTAAHRSPEDEDGFA